MRLFAGDILVQEEFEIEKEFTLDSFIRKSKSAGSRAVIRGINMISEGNYETRPMDTGKGRYFGWPERKDVNRFRKLGRRFR